MKLLLCILAVALPLVTLSLTACKDGDGFLVSGEFVGRVSNSNHLLVTVFVEEPDGSGQREARAYVCDGFTIGIVEWFPGSVEGNVFTLNSVDGDASIQIELLNDLATGILTLPSGEMHEFEAFPSSDGGGLYEELVISPDGTVSGTSYGGAVLEGFINAEVLVNADGLFSGSVTLPGGEEIHFEILVTGGQSDTFVAIILPLVEDLAGRGGGVKEGLPGVNFIIPWLF
ncbi:MAG: hypothetical protein ACREOW_17735 [Thermodesulfobacteriota bacterium]